MIIKYWRLFSFRPISIDGRFVTIKYVSIAFNKRIQYVNFILFNYSWYFKSISVSPNHHSKQSSYNLRKKCVEIFGCDVTEPNSRLPLSLISMKLNVHIFRLLLPTSCQSIQIPLYTCTSKKHELHILHLNVLILNLINVNLLFNYFLGDPILHWTEM